MPTMFGTSARRSTVSLRRSATVRPGTLYRISGRSTVPRSRGNAGTGLPASACCSTARPTGTASRRPAWRSVVSSIASAVELAPVPAMTGDAPARVLDRRLDQQAVLVDVDRGRFAGRADDDDAATCRSRRGNRSACAARADRARRPRCIGVAIATRLPVSIACRSLGNARFYPIRASSPVVSVGGRQRGRPGMARRDGGEALHDDRIVAPRRTRPCSNATTVSGAGPRVAQRRSSPGASRKSGLRGPAVDFVARANVS